MKRIADPIQGSNAIIAICSKVLESGKIRVSEKELDRLDKISDEEGNVPRLEHIVDLILDWPSKFLRLFKSSHGSSFEERRTSS